MKVLVTGAAGLIGSNVCQFFLRRQAEVYGVDNNMRQRFFGPEGSTRRQAEQLSQHPHYQHLQIDVRSAKQLAQKLPPTKFDLIVHCAAQPSHDKSREIPRLDFEVNVLGTLNMLEYLRLEQPQAVFVFTSTNKVYGDNPNRLPLKETALRYDYADGRDGIDENLSVDHNTHSLFGAGKLAADIYTQEYGRYFQLKTTVLRLGCVTGAAHAGVKLHGFLNFLVKSLLKEQRYQVIGYQGKQVRDQIDAADVASLIGEIYHQPTYGEVFNLGGGRENSASILELINILQEKLQIKAKITYNDQARVGDHICYITDLSKVKKFYPRWRIRKNLTTIIDEIIDAQKS